MSEPNKPGNDETEKTANPLFERARLEAELLAITDGQASVGAELVRAVRDTLTLGAQLLDEATCALPILAKSGDPRAKNCYEQYSGILSGSILEIVKHLKRMRSATKDLLPALSDIATSEAEECRRKLQRAIEAAEPSQ